jgi:hypothetical protein
LRFHIKRRLLYLAFGAVTFIGTYYAGASTHMSDEDAEELRRQFSEQIEGIDGSGIFLNNFVISLFMFVPAIGIGFGAFSGFATGMVFTALASQSPLVSSISPLIILITPFGIMEVFVYGLAMSRSGMLIHRVIKDKPWRAGNRRPFLEGSLVPTFIELGIAAAVLFAGAVIEWQLIEQFGGLDEATTIYL